MGLNDVPTPEFDNDQPLDNSFEDPVCGILVDPNETTFTSRFGGVEYYFCSAECKAKFDEDPAQYVSSVA